MTSQFIRLAAAAASLISLVAIGPASAGDPFEIEWSEIGEGVWAGVRPDSARIPVMGTTTVVIGEESVLLFDAGGAPLQSERVLAKVRELTDKPVSHVVISHWHGDHHLGVHKILEAFPEAELISHSFTKAAMAGAPMDYAIPIMNDGAKPLADALRGLLERGTFGDGSPIPDTLRAYYQDVLDYEAVIDAQYRGSRITPPTRTFEDRLVIDLGGRKAELIHLGNGNTKGDVILWLAAEKIVASADMVVRPTPYGFGSYPMEWAEGLRKLKGLGFKTLVPGHGDIQSDGAYLDLLIETLELVAAQVGPLVAAGKTLEEIRPEIDFSSVEQRFTGGDPLLATRFDVWFKTPIVESAYNVAAGVGNERLEREPASDR